AGHRKPSPMSALSRQSVEPWCRAWGRLICLGIERPQVAHFDGTVGLENDQHEVDRLLIDATAVLIDAVAGDFHAFRMHTLVAIVTIVFGSVAITVLILQAAGSQLFAGLLAGLEQGLLVIGVLGIRKHVGVVALLDEPLPSEARRQALPFFGREG